MKKVFLFSLFLSIILCSCTQLNHSKMQTEYGTVILKFSIDELNITSGSRTIEPKEAYIKEVTGWTVKFTPTSENSYLNEMTFELEAAGTEISSDTSYSIATGYYDISITSNAITNGTTEKSLYYTGSISNKEIVTGQNEINITVGRKKTATGNLSYTITLGDKITSSYAYVISLTDLNNGDNVYSSADIDSIISYAVEDSALTITGTSVPSAFYKMNISYTKNDGTGIIYGLRLDDPYVEIADDCTSTGEFDTKNYVTSQDFYATTDESSYNGLQANYPVNFSSLKSYLGTVTDLDEVNVYFSETEDLSSIAADDYSNINSGLTLNFYWGTFNFCTNGTFVTDFYINREGTYTDSEEVTHDAFTTLYELSEVLNNIDYSTKDVNVTVSGLIIESRESIFYSVKTISISGSAGVPEDVEALTEGFDWDSDDSTCGIKFSNENEGSIEAINISNIVLCNASGTDSTGSSGQYAGLCFHHLKSTEINITNCMFTGNSGGSIGESILFVDNAGDSPTAVITNCNFTENGSAGDDTAGVIRIHDTPVNLTVDGCTFARNQKADIYINADDAAVTVNNCILGSNINGDDTDARNIEYVTGTITLKGSTTGKIEVASGKSVTVDSGFTGGIKLIPDYTYTAYTTTVPLVVSADGTTLTDTILVFISLSNTEYSINTSGFLVAPSE